MSGKLTIRDRVKEFRRVKASELLPHPANWRRHPKSQIDALRGVLSELGFSDALLARETPDGLQLIDGHLRRDIMREAVVPVLVLDLDEEEAAKLLLTLDPLAAMAEADAGALAGLLESVSFESEAVNEMLAGLAGEGSVLAPTDPPEDPGPQLDRAAELQQKWGTALGQLWEIPSKATPGKSHRLMCGDSTREEDVGRLMAGQKAAASITDPPYNVGIDYGTNSDDATSEEYEAFSFAWSKLARKHADVLLFTPGTGRGPGMPNFLYWFLREAPFWILVWVKRNTVGHSSIGGFNAWEPIFLYGKPSRKVPQDIYDIPITVQSDVADEDGHKLHPTPKQVRLWAALIEDFTDRGESIYEPFLGSGTTMVAAEQTGRLCYGCELEPKYVAVALERLAGLGLEPRLVSD